MCFICLVWMPCELFNWLFNLNATKFSMDRKCVSYVWCGRCLVNLFGYFIWMQQHFMFGSIIWIFHWNATKFSMDMKCILTCNMDDILVHLFGYFIWMQQNSAWIENTFIYLVWTVFGFIYLVISFECNTSFSMDMKCIHTCNMDGILVHLFGYFIWMQQNSAWIENTFICLVWTAFGFIYLDTSFECNKIQHGYNLHDGKLEALASH